MRQFIKNIVAFTFYQVGLLKLIRLFILRNRAVVLMYHRVLPSLIEEQSFVQPGMYVTTRTFKKHLTFLKNEFEILSLSELVRRYKAGESIDGSCVITFDDGWRDNYLHAFPVLQEFKLPATIFLATGFIGSDHLFWPEELSFYLRQPELKKIIGNNQVLKQYVKQIPNANNESEFLDNAVIALKGWSPNKREDILDQFRVFFKRTPSNRLLMNWQEAKTMHDSGLVDFGAHTVNHVILDQVQMKEAEKEIAQSKSDIESYLNRSSDFFAYPNGNYNRDLRDIVKRNGFAGAVTTTKGWNSHQKDIFTISRIGIHEDISGTIPRFFARLLLPGF